MEEVLTNALQDYQAEFGYDFDPTWNPTSEKDLEDKIRSSKADFIAWRSRHAKIWKALSATAVPIMNLGPIASEAAGEAYPPAKAALGGLLSLVEASEKVSESYDFVEKMLDELEDVLSRWKIDFKHDVDEYLKQKMRQILLLLLSIIARSRILIKRHRVRHYLARLVFGQDRKTTELMKALEDLLQSEDRARAALSMEKISALWEKAINTESTQVVQRLNSTTVNLNSKTYADILEDKLENSGQWMREEQLYQSWMRNEVPLLMVLGGPGSGKSYLATGLINDLIQKHHNQGTGMNEVSVAYFYFDRKHDMTMMLKTMAYQIQATDTEYQRHVIQVLDQEEVRTAKESWARLFLDFFDGQINQNKRAVLVIDGFSEASPDETEVFAEEFVKTTMKNPGINIQFAMFGRLQLWGDFGFIPRERFIEIDAQKNKDDISTYVDQQLAKLRIFRSKGKNVETKVEFKKSILECCDGVFEWARLLLAKCKNQEKYQIRKLLRDPPQTLDEMTKSCFDQIMDDEDIDPSMLRTLLTWLAYGKRTLQFGDIYNAVRLTTGEDHALFWFNIVRKLSSVIRWKSSQVSQWDGSTVDEDQIEVLEDEDQGWSMQTRTTWISFSNSRIRDYVIHQSCHQEQANPHHERWPLPPQNSHCEIVKVCIKTLQDDTILESQRRGLVLYPLRFMVDHLRSLDLDHLDLQDQLEIAKGLVWMFHDKQGLYVVATACSDTQIGDELDFRAFWEVWIETNENTSLIQSWLKVASKAGLAVDTCTQKWIDAAASSLKELFRPLAELVRREWLTGDFSPKPFSELDDWERLMEFATRFLPAYDHMDGQEFPERYRFHHLVELQDVSRDDIVTSAAKSGLPQDGSYLISLAFTLLYVGKSRFSLEYLEAIPEDDTGFWMAAWCQARVCSSLSEHEKAIYWVRRAIELNPAARSVIEKALPVFLWSKNQPSEAWSAAQAAYDFDSESEDNQTYYLKGLYMNKDFQMIVKTARELDSRPIEGKPYSQLTHIILGDGGNITGEVIFALGQAYMLSQSHDDKTFIMDAIQKTSLAVNRTKNETGQIVWQTEVAKFNCRYVEDGIKSAIELFLSNISRIQESKLLDPAHKSTVLIQTRATFAYWLYLSALEQKRKSDSGLVLTISVLEELSMSAQAFDKTHLAAQNFYQAHVPCMFHGRYIREQGVKEEESWRKYFREPVLKYLSMLDDASDHNDFMGLFAARSVLKLAGDRENFVAIIAALYPHGAASHPVTNPSSTSVSSDRPLPISETMSNSSVDDNLTSVVPLERTTDDTDTDTGALPLSLDNTVKMSCCCCFAYTTYLDALYSCDECFNAYCERCLPTEEIHWVFGRECGSHHTFTRMFPIDDKYVDVVTVRRNGQVWLKRSWLEGLRALWTAPADEHDTNESPHDKESAKVAT